MTLLTSGTRGRVRRRASAKRRLGPRDRSPTPSCKMKCIRRQDPPDKTFARQDATYERGSEMSRGVKPGLARGPENQERIENGRSLTESRISEAWLSRQAKAQSKARNRRGRPSCKHQTPACDPSGSLYRRSRSRVSFATSLAGCSPMCDDENGARAQHPCQSLTHIATDERKREGARVWGGSVGINRRETIWGQGRYYRYYGKGKR